MATPFLTRYEVGENEYSPDLLRRIADESGRELGLIRRGFDSAAKTVANAFRTDSETYLRIENTGVASAGVAGVLRILPGIELAIRPKFLPPEASRWEADFAIAISISLAGRLLPQRKVTSDFGVSSDFLRLVANEWLDQYQRHRRAPIRLYGHEPVRDSEITGEIDWARFGDIDENGFLQSSLRLSKRNQFNEMMAAAADQLTGKIADPGTRRGLEDARSRLSPHGRRSRPVRRSFPSRSRQWSPLYELSRDIVAGKAPHFGEGNRSAPGYIFRTWPVWEALCERALDERDGGMTRQAVTELGTRDGSPFSVRPDIVLHRPDGSVVVVDAKYKKRGENRNTVVSSTDAYEALAFLEATGSSLAVLLYPDGDAENRQAELGALRIGETIKVGSRTIVAGKVTTRDLSQKDGLLLFSKNLQAGVASIVEAHAPSGV